MICVTGDTHGDYSRFSHKKIRSLKKDDFLMICGDFGFVWDGSPKEQAMLKKIGSKKYTTLFINGGHDNYELLSRYPEEDFMGGRARCISGNLYMLSSGYIFDLNGTEIFAFGGGQPDDIDAGFENTSWWEQELPDEAMLDTARKNLEANGSKADYIFTHEPPGSIAEFLNGGKNPVSPMSRLNIYFDSMKNEIDFKMWFFGKLHRNCHIPPRYTAVFDEPYIIG